MRLLLVALAAATTLLPVGPFALDPSRSRVEFVVKDNRGGFSGVARDVELKAVVREQGDTFAADVEARIDARTITTGIGVRDAQMRRDFLLTERYPFMTFRGTVTPRARPGGLPFAATLHGNLTIKDVTREIDVPLRVTALADAYLAEGQTTLRMSEFRIPIPRFLVFVAEDPVQVSFKLRLVPAR